MEIWNDHLLSKKTDSEGRKVSVSGYNLFCISCEVASPEQYARFIVLSFSQEHLSLFGSS